MTMYGIDVILRSYLSVFRTFSKFCKAQREIIARIPLNTSTALSHESHIQF